MQCNRITGFEKAFPEDTEIESHPTAIQEPLDDVVALKFCCQFEARKARLGYLKQCRADLQSIAGADVLFQQALDSQVFTKRSPGQLPTQLLPPERIMLRRV